MSKITLDAQLRQRLNGLDQELEICDESGQTVGHFLPEAQYLKMLYRIAEAACPHTEEELKRLQKQTGGRPLAEWKREMGIE